MQTNSLYSNNTYFDYIPIWNSSDSPLPLKIASAVGAIIINLGILLANVGIGLANVGIGIGSLFSSPFASSSTHFNDVSSRRDPYALASAPPFNPYALASAPPWQTEWGPRPNSYD